MNIIFVTKTTAAQNEVTLSYHRVHGQYLLAFVFAAAIVRFSMSGDCIIHVQCTMYMYLLYTATTQSSEIIMN